MHFPALKAYLDKYPTLSGSIRLLDDYLFELLSSYQDRDISPAITAKKLGVNEATAIILLMFAHEAKVITPQYYVYCPNTEDFLATYASFEELPSSVFCPYDEQQHGSNEYFTELTFRFTPQVSNLEVTSLIS